jgi:hypothetical protein
MRMADAKIIARPWQPQDLIDDLQGIIDEECDNYLNTRRTTLCMARDYLKEHFAKDNNVPSKWIPVTERLPEGDKVVLCYKADRGIRLGKLLDATYANGVQAFMDRDRVFAFGVTHWMPLPEPPKGE